MKMMKDMRRSVVVTGASTGIGEATALYLAGMGFQVFAGVRRLEDGLALTKKGGDHIRPILLDVTSADSVVQSAAEVQASLAGSTVAGLVNNAGVAVGGPLEFVPMDEFRRQIEVNVTGQLAATQAFLPLLRVARGRIINMGSVSGRIASPFLGPYVASKFALEALTTALRLELYPWGIQVSIVTPGVIQTPIWDKAISDFDRIRTAMPTEATNLYGKILDGMRNRLTNVHTKGVPAIEVAKAVAHALTATRPRRRYPVGSDARLVELLLLLPERVRESMVIRKIYGRI